MGERGGFSDICKYLALEYLKILAINLVILLKNIKKNGDPECSYNGAFLPLPHPLKITLMYGVGSFSQLEICHVLNLVKFCHVTRCSFSGEMQSERIERIHFAEISEVSFSIVINTIFRLIDSLHKSEDFGHPNYILST